MLDYLHRRCRIAPKTQWEKTGSSKHAPGLKKLPYPVDFREKKAHRNNKPTNNKPSN
jgi:hypothetical protein